MAKSTAKDSASSFVGPIRRSKRLQTKNAKNKSNDPNTSPEMSNLHLISSSASHSLKISKHTTVKKPPIPFGILRRSARLARPLTEFTLFPNLLQEMREHILKQLDSKSLFNYSRCASLCNSEVQRFNTKVADSLAICEEWDGINVHVVYEKVITPETVEFRKIVEKKFMFTECQNILLDIKNYLTERFKFVKNGSVFLININMKTWPKELLEMKKIANIVSWKVSLYPSMLQDFLDFLKSSDKFNRVREIMDIEDVKRKIIQKPDFAAPQNIAKVAVIWSTEYERPDLFGPYFEYQLKKKITDDAIRAEIRHMNSHKERRLQFLRINLSGRGSRVFTPVNLFPMPEFRDIEYFNGGEFQFGRVCGYIENYGKTLCLEAVDGNSAGYSSDN